MVYYGLSSLWEYLGEDIGYTRPLGRTTLVEWVIFHPLLWIKGWWTRRVIIILFVLSTFYYLWRTCRFEPHCTNKILSQLHTYEVRGWMDWRSEGTYWYLMETPLMLRWSVTIPRKVDKTLYEDMMDDILFTEWMMNYGGRKIDYWGGDIIWWLDLYLRSILCGVGHI